MKGFDSSKALDDLEGLIKGLTRPNNTLSNHYKEIKKITNYLDGIYNKGLTDGFEEALKTNSIKL
ncbi:hypothetical protein PL373_18915 [Tenacibaculum maritimum]|nr:hypothetical protein [Tenacibaculum maritimum]MDB0603160.1 hypothetical protein [Tenacibaculum maritimum]MDB0610423.1 hypothetical protein [Tenacibaculum maritimum]